MVAHGRWSRGYKIQDDDGETVIRKVDPKDMLMVSDEDPGNDDTLSDAVSIGCKQHARIKQILQRRIAFLIDIPLYICYTLSICYKKLNTTWHGTNNYASSMES